ncbi:hypothetical protein B0H17DRAFT_1144959 [Mycena rosella]|uniref:Uncharacterized protein n=1 Tax=Mycena rosella TaxID=1033263 RepID=A0AAD7G540_MYCRO|nr:hypothetical protein B0H17DRAFT_1144959 [Mycena rosella]
MFGNRAERPRWDATDTPLIHILMLPTAIACLSDLSESNKGKLRELKWKKVAGTQFEEKKLRELKLKKKLRELSKKKKVVGMPSSRKFSWPTQNEAKTCGNRKKELKKLRE